jgi:DNA-binding transcriptional ArsR family regulator
MLELSFTTADVAYTRFAFSPLWEVVASVLVLKGELGRDIHARWVTRAGERLRGFDWRLLGDLVVPEARVIPGFICPPPAAPLPDLDTELVTLRATPADQIARELSAIPAITSPPPDAGALADVIEEYWDRALAPFWPRIRTLLEADVQYRARRLTTGGASALFADLNPAVRWRNDRLLVDHPRVTARRGLRGKGLLLVPSAFTWPRVFSITVPGWQPTLRYPPRGVAELWTDRKVTPSAALVGVFGASRARLLAELDNPASTTELAARIGLTPGGVSQHLTALKAAGLVSSHRFGREVRYARTAVAESLLDMREGDRSATERPPSRDSD